ncbi:DUF418 domain-containing protein [Labilibaculum euxinus]
MNTPAIKNRLHVVDALRGFALVSIMLLHNIEHFDVYFSPANLPEWMVSLDKIIWDSLFFLFGGKSYAIFALLFGLTFFIQTNNQNKRGNDFRARFAWRLLLLFIFGIINSAFYQGDILTLYAFVGLFLIPLVKLNNKWILAIALLLFIQPYELFSLFKAIQNPDIKIANPISWTYFGKMDEYVKADSFLGTVYGNLTNGKRAVIAWSWENGRFFHILSTFLFGMLAGRMNLFTKSDKNTKFWTKTFIISIIAFIPLFILQKNLSGLIGSEAIRRSVQTIETSWTNLSFMVFLVSGFVLLFNTNAFRNVLTPFSAIGKMSLSNYVFQSMLGAGIYYGFGLGMYRYTGATYSLLIGIGLALILGLFCTWWDKKHSHGPLEAIWHKATWLGAK